jgi:hypothetical protein
VTTGDGRELAPRGEQAKSDAREDARSAARAKDAPTKPGRWARLSARAKDALGGAEARERRLRDVLLTGPVFVTYHLGVVFLSVRNGLDPITDLTLSILHGSLLGYLGLTVLVALGLVAAMRLTGVGGKLKPLVWALRLGEGAVYAVAMCSIAQAATAHTLGTKKGYGPFASIVMSMGAGFYEELAFRVILFGAGAWLVRKWKTGAASAGGEIIWACVAAACFSGVHYVGSLSDSFTLQSFLFRLVCGLVLTAIYRFRGFATAVWTHALYDVGVMTLA